MVVSILVVSTEASREAEVCKLDVSVAIEKNVVRLDITGQIKDGQ